MKNRAVDVESALAGDICSRTLENRYRFWPGSSASHPPQLPHHCTPIRSSATAKGSTSATHLARGIGIGTQTPIPVPTRCRATTTRPAPCGSFSAISTGLARDSGRGDLRARPAADVLTTAVPRRDEPVAGVRPAPRPGATRDERLQTVVLLHDLVLTEVQPMRPATRYRHPAARAIVPMRSAGSTGLAT
jgi:hypothetical protein